jgi:hypothetical protein
MQLAALGRRALDITGCNMTKNTSMSIIFYALNEQLQHCKNERLKYFNKQCKIQNFKTCVACCMLHGITSGSNHTHQCKSIVPEALSSRSQFGRCRKMLSWVCAVLLRITGIPKPNGRKTLTVQSTPVLDTVHLRHISLIPVELRRVFCVQLT